MNPNVNQIMGNQTTITSERYISEMGKIMTSQKTLLARKLSESKELKMIGLAIAIAGVVSALILGGILGWSGVGSLPHPGFILCTALPGGTGGAMALAGLIVLIVGAVKGRGMKKLTREDVEKWYQKDLEDLRRPEREQAAKEERLRKAQEAAAAKLKEAEEQEAQRKADLERLKDAPVN